MEVLPHDISARRQFLEFSMPQWNPAIPRSSRCGLSIVFQSNSEDMMPASPTSNPLHDQLTSLAVKNPACEQCRAEGFDFTAYFHNTKIFSRPPHLFIRNIEASYVLRRHLKCLLAKYACRKTPRESLEGVEAEILSYLQIEDCLVLLILVHDGPQLLITSTPLATLYVNLSVGVQRVETLASAVRINAGDPPCISVVLDAVCTWARATGGQLWVQAQDHQSRFPWQKAKEVVLEFRMAWERVWVACQDGSQEESSI